MKLKILSLNIHKGFSFRNKFTLNELKALVRREKANIVFLQEVQGEHLEKKEKIENWPVESQFEFLADQIWPHYAYGKNAVYPKGHHGNAILSQLPIKEFRNYDISTNSFEKRGVLYAKVKNPENNKTINLVCSHLNLFSKGRRKQIAWVADLLDQIIKPHEPLILAGDFNDWKEEATDILESKLRLREVFLHSNGDHARTFPSIRPMLKLDRIYTRGLKIVSATTLTNSEWSSISDHIALVSELSWEH